MKINSNIFSFPPYISTGWSNVAALHMKEKDLVVTMIDGDIIQIPKLEPDTLEKIFDAHASYLEGHSHPSPSKTSQTPVFPFQHAMGQQQDKDPFLHFGIGAMDAWGAALQHNPAQANMPPLPEEVLEKVRSISKIIAPDDPMASPKPEPHCNCMHCQIARAINQGLGNPDLYQQEEKEEEPVSEDELSFQQWEIVQTDDKLYQVSNRLDSQEKYSVFLGNPVGCTCGISGCEHILAVLKS